MMTDKMIEKFESAGFKRWTKYDKDRLYIDAEGLGLSYNRYNTGNIAYAEWQGEKISNSHAREMMSCKMYVDVATGEAHYDGGSKYIEDAFNAKVEELLQGGTESDAQEADEEGAKTANAKMEKLVAENKDKLEAAGVFYVPTDPDCYGNVSDFDYEKIVDEFVSWLEAYGIETERQDDSNYTGFWLGDLGSDDRRYIEDEIWEAFNDEKSIWDSCVIREGADD